eukprot:TRINITY_DN48923_c0_g1_i1.p1 TRINITY_DN48923_c0_g1~~TRINITY_DN48923_c0_g1_i1.p1  ORF type:complete len:318 (+),score=52.19 TRINITY_DN48923_c0_g1_i1:84-1037(+)
MVALDGQAANCVVQCVGRTLNEVWLAEDMGPLLRLIGARDGARLASTNKGFCQRLPPLLEHIQKVKADPANESEHLQALEMQEVLADLDNLVEEAGRRCGGPLPSFSACVNDLTALEAALHTEMRYVHGPDWDLKPGKLISRKGTWLKHTTRFSWEISQQDRLYLPEGVALPVLQIGRVVDKEELSLHEWSAQHLRVWLKPSIVRTLEGRRNVWFVYMPHFEGEGHMIVANVDTWLKRSTQMSGDLQTFELVYVPKSMVIHLVCPPEPVTEEWEKSRHMHVHRHRKLTLAGFPTTVRRDKYDIFVGQSEDLPRPRAF